MGKIYQYSEDETALEDYYRRIETAIMDFCALDVFGEAGLDLLGASAQQFNACMQYVGKTVFVRPIPNSKRHRTVIDLNNMTLLYGLLDYYIYLCNIYSKVPNATGFSYFVGISTNTLYDWADGFRYSSDYGGNVGYKSVPEEITRARSIILKTIKKLNEDTLLSRLENHSNPVGMIAAGNVRHNWDNRRAESADQTRQIESNVIASKYLQLETDQNEIVSDFQTIPENNSNNWE